MTKGWRGHAAERAALTLGRLLLLLWLRPRGRGVQRQNGLLEVWPGGSSHSSGVAGAGWSGGGGGLTEEVQAQERILSARGLGRSGIGFRGDLARLGAGGARSGDGIIAADKIDLRLRGSDVSGGRGGLADRTLANRFSALDVLFLLNQAQRHIVVAIYVEAGRVGNGAVHCPSLELVLGADKVLNLGFRGDVAGRQLGLPIFVRARITPAEDASKLLVGPGIEIDRLDSANVRTHATVNA